jgi:hypothetical protein
MKKLWIICGIFLFLFGSTSLVYADAGPKPELRITVNHAPDELYYLDLLVRSSYLGQNDTDLDSFDQAMIEDLKSLVDQGWYPALVSGTSVPLFGRLIGKQKDSKMVHVFGYRIPDQFKIIMVTQSGKITVSETLTMESFYMSLQFDAESGKITKPNVAVFIGLQFISTLIPTLILEGLILLLFGLFTKRNFKVFLIMNLVTQIALTAILGMTLINAGLLSAIFVLILSEGLIWLFEILVCWLLFDKKKKTGRRILYALVANMASFGLGLILLFMQFSWI